MAPGRQCEGTGKERRGVVSNRGGRVSLFIAANGAAVGGCSLICMGVVFSLVLEVKLTPTLILSFYWISEGG